MRVLSKACIYGIRASLFIVAAGKDKKYVPISHIAKELGISFYFLTKILQMLTEHKITVSHRGPSGGVSLARPASEITLMDMVKAIEPDHSLEECFLGLPKCGEKEPCPLHSFWGGTRDRIVSKLENTDLESLGRQVRDDGYRLSM
jgi:Rrf2 family protein